MHADTGTGRRPTREQLIRADVQARSRPGGQPVTGRPGPRRPFVQSSDYHSVPPQCDLVGARRMPTCPGFPSRSERRLHDPLESPRPQTRPTACPRPDSATGGRRTRPARCSARFGDQRPQAVGAVRSTSSLHRIQPSRPTSSRPCRRTSADRIPAAIGRGPGRHPRRSFSPNSNLRGPVGREEARVCQVDGPNVEKSLIFALVDNNAGRVVRQAVRGEGCLEPVERVVTNHATA